MRRLLTALDVFLGDTEVVAGGGGSGDACRGSGCVVLQELLTAD